MAVGVGLGDAAMVLSPTLLTSLRRVAALPVRDPTMAFTGGTTAGVVDPTRAVMTGGVGGGYNPMNVPVGAGDVKASFELSLPVVAGVAAIGILLAALWYQNRKKGRR
jgi:hypothetical protein